MGRNLINIEEVSKAYGTRRLLDAVSLGMAEQERIGVVGRNGDGKTTLLRVLAGREPPDSGRVTHVGGLTMGLLDQHDALDPDAVVGDLLFAGRAEHEWAGDPRVREVLTGLLGGLDLPGLPAGPASRMAQLSGGERRRVALAHVLTGEHDVLILDEPTNHLDVEGVSWLAEHLGRRRSALLVVTHDRWFLDEVCTATWEVGEGGVRAYDGGYSAYVLARAERERIGAADEARRLNLLRKELAWLRRGPPARTSKPRFRVEAANALIAGEPPARDRVELLRFSAARLGRTVLEAHQVTVRLGDRVLLDHVTWRLGPGDRVGLVGVNGAGKTSLLRLLLSQLRPASGQVITGVTVRPAYLSQEVAELDPGLRVLEAVENVSRVVDLGGGRQLSASQLCERFGFSGNRQWTPVADLSGGERRRLQLLRLLITEPNVLLLDEPTNDLDIETLTALEDLLDGWPGSLMVVSHDRYFLERVCDRTLALLGDGTLRDLPGGVEQYLALRRAARSTAGGGAGGSGGAAAPAGPAPSEGAVGRAAPQGPVVRPRAAAEVRQARKDLSRIERRLDRITREELELHHEIAAHPTEYERVSNCDTRLRALAADKAALEEEWLAVAEVAHDE